MSNQLHSHACLYVSPLNLLCAYMSCYITTQHKTMKWKLKVTSGKVKFTVTDNNCGGGGEANGLQFSVMTKV